MDTKTSKVFRGYQKLKLEGDAIYIYIYSFFLQLFKNSFHLIQKKKFSKKVFHILFDLTHSDEYYSDMLCVYKGKSKYNVKYVFWYRILFFISFKYIFFKFKF